MIICVERRYKLYAGKGIMNLLLGQTSPEVELVCDLIEEGECWFASKPFT
jgi:hypothetical protein